MDLDEEELEETKKLNRRNKKVDKLIENYGEKVYEMIVEGVE